MAPVDGLRGVPQMSNESAVSRDGEGGALRMELEVDDVSEEDGDREALSHRRAQDPKDHVAAAPYPKYGCDVRPRCVAVADLCGTRVALPDYHGGAGHQVLHLLDFVQ